MKNMIQYVVGSRRPAFCCFVSQSRTFNILGSPKPARQRNFAPSGTCRLIWTSQAIQKECVFINPRAHACGNPLKENTILWGCPTSYIVLMPGCSPCSHTVSTKIFQAFLDFVALLWRRLGSSCHPNIRLLGARACCACHKHLLHIACPSQRHWHRIFTSTACLRPYTCDSAMPFSQPPTSAKLCRNPCHPSYRNASIFISLLIQSLICTPRFFGGAPWGYKRP